MIELRHGFKDRCATSIRVGLTTGRLLPLAPQASQVGNAALIEREAVTLPLAQPGRD